MMKLIPLEEHDVKKSINPTKLKRTVIKEKDQLMINEAMSDYYSNVHDKNRSEDGWSQAGDKYWIDNFLRAKNIAASKVAGVKTSKVPAFY